MAPDQPNVPPPLPPQPYHAAMPPGYGYALPPRTNQLALASMINGLASVGVLLLLDVLRSVLPYMLGPSVGFGMPYYLVYSWLGTLIGLLAFAGLITAVVFGHIALGRANRFPWLRPTRRQALTGIIAGYAGLALQLLLPIVIVLVIIFLNGGHIRG